MSDVQPADFATADYRSVLRRLTTLDEEAADLRAEAERWFDGRLAAADEAVRQADEAVRGAAEATVAAQRELERVDARALGLWAEYVHKVGPVAERYGRTMPAPAIPRQRTERDAGDYLDEVAAKVSYIAPPQPLNLGVKTMFGLFGAAGGLVGGLLFEALHKMAGSQQQQTGTWRDALPVVALVVFLACPVLAVVAAKKVADRRQVGLDTSTVVTVLLAGLAAGAIVIAAMGL
jgi:hypothetical protein